MANIGDVLLVPETGWRRYDDNDSNITYEGSSWKYYSNYGGYNLYNKTDHECFYGNEKVKFNFSKKKLRLIMYTTGVSGFNLNINGKDMGNYNIELNKGTVLAFEYFSPYSVNCCIITCLDKSYFKNSKTRLCLDAIDIDENGILKPFNPNIGIYLLKKDSNYYSLKENYYDESLDSYAGIEISQLNISNFNNYGLNDLSLIHSNALLKLIDNKYNITMLK